MDLKFDQKYNHVHFIGIGGISMSGLAEILLSKSFTISGSDIKESAITNHLSSLGVNVKIGQSYDNITEDMDLIVYTAAVKLDNPELVSAKDKSITIIDRAELLGKIMDSYKYSFAISGTHGKTTTSSMVSEILLQADTDPTISIGGILPTINSNIKIGNSEYFVAEACEYFESFLKFNPLIGVILNIEADHLDYFKDLNHIRHAFYEFAKKIPACGSLIINHDIDDVDGFVKGLKCNVVTYSTVSQDATWSVQNIIHETDGTNTFDIYYKGEFVQHIHLNVPGDHNISNALAACAASHCVGVSPENFAKGLGHFNGTQRRFQHKGKFNNVTVVDDYAHHPTEISATLSAAKNISHNKLWVVFQPHTFTRTKSFLNEFADALSMADNVIISKIYAAREADLGEISGKDLANKINLLGTPTVYFDEFSDIEKYVLTHCSENDLLITMGAGDINIVGENLVK